MFKFDRNNKEYVCKEAQINVNEVAFVCTPTKNEMKSYENFENLAATFYFNCNYEGQSSTLGPGRYDIPQMGIPNDSISSIRIPNGLKVTIFEHGGFGGRSLELTGDEACLVNREKDGLNFNDVTSSIIIEKINA